MQFNDTLKAFSNPKSQLLLNPFGFVGFCLECRQMAFVSRLKDFIKTMHEYEYVNIPKSQNTLLEFDFCSCFQEPLKGLPARASEGQLAFDW